MVANDNRFIEVKRGQASALDFAWFAKAIPKGQITVVRTTPFAADRLRGVTLEESLGGHA